MGLLILISLLIIGYLTGSYFEKRHYQSLQEREQKFKHIEVISGEWKNHLDNSNEVTLISSGVVVASDYFKTFVSGLKNIFGGRMNSYESLIDRGRREALLRVLEKSQAWGAHKIINVRIETSTINATKQGKGTLPCVELFVYGTAVRKNNG